MHIHRKPSFLRGYAVQRLRRGASMAAQDLLGMYGKSQVGRGEVAGSSSPPL